MVIDGTDPFAASKPDARLIRLLIRACRFNAALAQGEGIHFAGSGGCCSNATIASGAGLAPEHSGMPTGGNSAFLVRPNFRDQHQRQSRFSVPSYQRPARRGFVRRASQESGQCPVSGPAARGFYASSFTFHSRFFTDRSGP
jgi:hypothetical protein